LRLRAALLLVCIALTGCAVSPCETRPPVRIQLLLVNDVYQLQPVDGRGGLARVATLVRGLRARTPQTLFVLAGDTLSPSVLSTIFQGRQMVEVWNALGLDAAVFGNHEFDFGPAVLRQRMQESRFPWLGANVVDAATSRPWGGAEATLIREWSGVRVGMVGVTLPRTARSSNPGPGIVFAPAVESAQRAIADLGALDLRVALTHLEIEQDHRLAAAVPLDVILGGHDHAPVVEMEGGTLIIKAGSDSVNVGQVEYELGCGARVLSQRHRLIPVDSTVADAPDVVRLVARYHTEAGPQLERPIAELRVPLDTRDSVIRREPTPVGAFVARVMRDRMGADVGLLNAGGIRGNRVIPSGPLSMLDVATLLPFRNTVALLEVDGAALRAILEHSVEALPRPNGRFLQTAGLDYTMNASRPAGSRVLSASVAGRALEPARRYRVAVPDFLARGGDGYVLLAQARSLLSSEDGPGLIEIVVEALERGASP
jgi:2',3'-cyclic-nucleotide 2'-phosphodiesterase (5'-nucleotidase family)